MLELYDVRLSSLARYLEAVASHEGESITVLAAFAGSSTRTARRALPVLDTLGLIKPLDAGGYSCTAPEIRRGAPKEVVESVLKSAILRFRPFELVCEGLALGESEKDALRKAAALVGRPADREKLRSVVAWAIDLGLLERNSGVLSIRSDIAAASPQDWSVISADDLTSQAKARLYVGRRLGRAVTQAMDSVDIDLLQDAVLSFQSKPKLASSKAGQALENVLREIAGLKGKKAEAAKCNGAGQLGALLVGANIIHPNHLHWINAVTAVRNASGHSKDKKTTTAWLIESDGAFNAVSGAISTIRSIYLFVLKGKQLF